MSEQWNDLDVDAVCARLRKVLDETRGRSRRDFLAALAGAATLPLLARTAPAAVRTAYNIY